MQGVAGDDFQVQRLGGRFRRDEGCPRQQYGSRRIAVAGEGETLRPEREAGAGKQGVQIDFERVFPQLQGKRRSFQKPVARVPETPVEPGISGEKFRRDFQLPRLCVEGADRVAAFSHETFADDSGDQQGFGTGMKFPGSASAAVDFVGVECVERPFCGDGPASGNADFDRKQFQARPVSLPGVVDAESVDAGGLVEHFIAVAAPAVRLTAGGNLPDGFDEAVPDHGGPGELEIFVAAVEQAQTHLANRRIRRNPESGGNRKPGEFRQFPLLREREGDVLGFLRIPGDRDSVAGTRKKNRFLLARNMQIQPPVRRKPDAFRRGGCGDELEQQKKRKKNARFHIMILRD